MSLRFSLPALARELIFSPHGGLQSLGSEDSAEKFFSLAFLKNVTSGSCLGWEFFLSFS